MVAGSGRSGKRERRFPVRGRRALGVCSPRVPKTFRNPMNQTLKAITATIVGAQEAGVRDVQPVGVPDRFRQHVVGNVECDYLPEEACERKGEAAHASA